MKRFLTCFITVLLLVAILAIPASAAASPRAELSSASGLPGRQAYMTLYLYDVENVEGFAIEATGLPMNGSDTTWTVNPALWNVNPYQAACFYAQATDMNGAVVILAFDIPASVDPGSYTVSLSLRVTYLGVQGSATLPLTCSGTVTVSNPAVSIALDQKSAALDMSVEKTKTLTATVTGEVPDLPHTSGAVTWSGYSA